MLIPDELVALASERRIIPFLGAGFSDSLGLPSWDEMLRGLCGRMEGALPFDELKDATGGDYLRIAEYLFLKCDRRIGPIRRHIDRAMTPNGPVLKSSPHVELVNLGSQQIYTTNYDDAVESAYRALGLPVDVIVLPKDIAMANPTKTQVVKYHGDLDHEETLVLTESAYYKRLDFDSPMDLKFRSDLLGKSVLFMGYSFRDVNIRVIWFKLMDMMRDIPEGERRASYIVQLSPNPALEELYAAVGIRTIVLSPDKPVRDAEHRSALLSEFLLKLSLAADTAPVSSGSAYGRGPVIVSPALCSIVVREEPRRSTKSEDLFRFGGYLPMSNPRFSRLLNGRVPELLRAERDAALNELLPRLSLTTEGEYAQIVTLSPPSPNLTAIIVRVLASQGGSPPRELRRSLVHRISDWGKIWSSKLTDKHARGVLQRLESELEYQARAGADEDIAYLADLGARLATGMLTDDPEIQKSAADFVQFGASMYPSLALYQPVPDGPPVLTSILQEVEERSADFKPLPWFASQLRKLGMSEEDEVALRKALEDRNRRQVKPDRPRPTGTSTRKPNQAQQRASAGDPAERSPADAHKQE